MVSLIFLMTALSATFTTTHIVSRYNAGMAVILTSDNTNFAIPANTFFNMRLVNLAILGIGVAIFLYLRKKIDEKKESIFDIEIVREDEEHLGSWANRSDSTFYFFRLRRDGGFSAKSVENGSKDTIHVSGKYEIVASGVNNNTAFYPRLITMNNNNDTVFNFFISYITPYDSKAEKVDRMVLKPDSIYDTTGYVFYRIKQ